jgi:enoyl-CoA hydratase/carnithine racemase
MVAGYQRAAKLLLLGEPFSVEEAREAGIITEVVAPESVVPSAMATARKLAERPQSSVRATKNLLKKQTQAAMIAALNEESDTFTRMLGEPAAKEAFSAFLGKRKPDFSKLG